MLVRSRGTKTPETLGSANHAMKVAGALVIVALSCVALPALIRAQTPPSPPPRSQAFEDSIRHEIRLRQDRLTQLRDKVRNSDDAELDAALKDLQNIIDELEGELSDIQVKVDENTILFSNTSGDLRIEIPDDIGQRVSEGISAVTLDIQREIERFQNAANDWNFNVFGQPKKQKPKKIVGDDMFAMRKDRLVNEDERVTGDVVVLMGDATILGEVDGSITVIGGELILGDESEVHGEVNVLLGKFLRDDDAVVDGDVYEISGGAADGVWGMLTEGPAGLVVKSTGLLVLAVLLLVTLAITPGRRLEAVDAALTDTAGRSFTIGALLLVLGHLLLLISQMRNGKIGAGSSATALTLLRILNKS